jgi:guanylate kinase
LNPHFLFLRPPTFEDLKIRLLKRGTEDAKTIIERLKTSEKELDLVLNKKEGFDFYTHHLVSGDLQETKEEFSRILQSLYPEVIKP